MPQFIVIRFVDFHAAAERRVTPGLAGRALVIGGARDARGDVVAVSLEARSLGVHVGMPLREAACRAPHAVFLPGRLDRALDFACELDEAVRRLAPHVAWTTIDEATLECEARGADALVDAVTAACAAPFGLTTAIGIAGSQIAARAAARVVGQRGVLHVLPGYERRFLSRLDVAWLDGMSPALLARLRARALDTFGDLAALSTAELQHTIGREGPVLARLAAGDDDRRIAGAARPRRLCRTVAFDRLVADATPPQAALEAQIETLTQRARQFGCGARSVSLRVEYEDASTAQHSTALRAPTTDPAPLVVALRAIAARLQLDTRPWRCATVSIGALTALSQQLSLFATHPGARPVVRLRTRAGFAALAALPYLQRRRA